MHEDFQFGQYRDVAVLSVGNPTFCASGVMPDIAHAHSVKKKAHPARALFSRALPCRHLPDQHEANGVQWAPQRAGMALAWLVGMLTFSTALRQGIKAMGGALPWQTPIVAASGWL
ncbi:hypothetical protein [Xanthomonas sp. 3058]|uniref:hypothetical protein n=1 Tax=Xanthomonas sp. 3058 TaxID=3035314 RepID=UPI0018104B92|nr:hypothetical protein [Xanthomonas sp. 3058]MBB5863032.1 hypothetical protein [Xanthomonas sp. 3058]